METNETNETMGQNSRADFAPVEPDDASPEIESARAHIEETRAQMTETIDAIKEKMSPAHLVEEAKESVKESIKEATVGKVEHLAETVVDLAKGAAATASGALHSAVDFVTGKAGPAAETAMETTREKIAPVMDTAKAAGVTVKGAGATIVDTVRRNPLPAAVIGFGLGWLALSMRKRQNGGNSLYEREAPYDGRNGGAYGRPLPEDSWDATSSQRAVVTAATDALHGAGDAVNHFATGARDKASDLAVATKEKAQAGYSALDHWVHENPLAAGAVALLVGAAVGLALPATAKENELMGPKRDELAHKAAETAQDVVGKVQTVAEKAIGTAKVALGDATQQVKAEVQNEAQNQGLTVA
jgi:hypothetical protein